MKNIIKKIFLGTSLIAPVSLVVSCGRQVNTDEKNKQEILFSNQEIKNIAENVWLENSLKSLYLKIDQSELSESEQYKEDSYQIYKSFLETKFQKDPNYLKKEISELLTNAKINSSDLSKLQSILDGNMVKPNKEQFEILYNIDNSPIKTITQKNLIVYRYLTQSDEKDIKITNKDAYTLNKDNYDINNFNLINYLIQKKIVQEWSYKNTSADDIYTKPFRSIASVKDYQDLTQDTSAASKIISTDLNILDKSYLLSLNGYNGIKSLDLQLDYSIDKLRQITQPDSLVGFYDPNNKKLINVNQKTQDLLLDNSLNVSFNGKTDVAFYNRILPLSVTELVDNPDKEKAKETPKINKTYLTLKNSVFSKNLTKLSAMLYDFDDSLYTTAQNAFVELGYKIKLELDNEKIKKVLEGVKYVI
ncbi:HinT-interacting membrane complex lipoprotein P60 [Mycoplasma leonicaptivi]|uniref:HinT-interacting membrane complex lipoprotein P60 n=1 Tax=Mycoplasma leonicaptivi TaxID=36742 RepID=UPI000482353A|nr:hypothetical protein [Mycoplasma leonicaptivi]